jgi:serine/threonine protein kinase
MINYSFFHSFCEAAGTPCGLAKVFKGCAGCGCRYTNKVDCWSVGVLLYELLVGQAPFAAVSAHTHTYTHTTHTHLQQLMTFS